VWVHNPKASYSEIHSYKLNFQCTNNRDEYEALMLGLKLLKKLGTRRISVRGNSKLIIKQIKGEYSGKHSILRDYINVVLYFYNVLLNMTCR
jgi:ribonuclease HI